MKRNFGIRGFTLIELLVTMTVIAILVAILLPALAAAQKRSKRGACISNLKQIGVGFHLFKHDHEDRLPAAVPKAEGGVKEFFFLPGPFIDRGWMTNEFRVYQAMSNVLETPKILICQGDRLRVPVERFEDLKPNANWRHPNVSYPALISFVGHGDGPKAILSGDSAANQKMLDEYSRTFAGDGERLAVLHLWTNHGKELGGNWLFGDGRVEAVPWIEQGAPSSSVLRLPP